MNEQEINNFNLLNIKRLYLKTGTNFQVGLNAREIIFFSPDSDEVGYFILPKEGKVWVFVPSNSVDYLVLGE